MVTGKCSVQHYYEILLESISDSVKMSRSMSLNLCKDEYDLIKRPSLQQFRDLSMFVQPFGKSHFWTILSFAHLNQIVRENDQRAVAISDNRILNKGTRS